MYSSNPDIVTVTKRVGWEKLARYSLDAQTAEYGAHIIVSEVGCELPYYPAPKPKRKYNLNRSLNEALRHCTSEYIIFYQDFIELEPTTVEYLMENAAPDRLISTATHENGKFDARYLGLDTLRPCRPEEWEANVALAPLKLFYELGGFDEEYDDRWSWDNVNIADRAEMIGYKFFIDERVKPKLISHPRDTSRENNGDFHRLRMLEISLGKRPITCEYLVQSKSKLT